MSKQTSGAITQDTVGVNGLVQGLVGKAELITLELAQDACIFVDDIQATLGTPDEIDIITTKGLQGCLGIAVFGVSGQTDKAGYAFVHSAKWQNQDWWSGQEGAELISFAKKFDKLWVIHNVHLIQKHHQSRYTDLSGQQDVFSCLRHGSICS